MKTLRISILTIGLIINAYSQNDTTMPRYALTFGIADNFRLSSFGLDIAVKKILDEAHQLRLQLSPRISTNHFEADVNSGSTLNKNTTEYYALSFAGDYLWILIKEDELQLYGGGGGIITIGQNNQHQENTNSSGSLQISDLKDPFISGGFRGSLGVEWRVTSHIGIHSEYLGTTQYQWEKAKSSITTNGIETSSTSNKTTRFTLTTNVLFGISVYL